MHVVTWHDKDEPDRLYIVEHDVRPHGVHVNMLVGRSRARAFGKNDGNIHA